MTDPAESVLGDGVPGDAVVVDASLEAAVGRQEGVQPAPGAGEAVVIPRGALVAARAADDKSGRDTVVLAMGALFGLVDAFVVTSGLNLRQVKSMVEEIELQVKADDGRGPVRIEGQREGSWVLMDYGDFLVHVFEQETREFYDLEHLWSGAPRIPWSDGPVPPG